MNDFQPWLELIYCDNWTNISRHAMFAHMPIIRDIVYGATHHGADFTAMCEALNISPDDLNDSEIKVDFQQACQSWELAIRQTKDNLLGLHIGETSSPSIMGILGNLMQSCPDLFSAYTKLTEFSSVATDMFRYSIKQKNNTVTLAYEPAPVWTKSFPQGARHATEQAMAGTLHVFYLLSGKKIRPVETSFRHKRAGDGTTYSDVFQSPIQFNAAVNQLVFRKADLETHVISYDRSLLAVFEKMLKEKQAPRNDSINEQVKKLILSDCHGRIPSLSMIAVRMNMTARTLQRRLADENISFRSLVQEIQQELTAQLMKSKHVRLSQVSEFLGYSDPAAFHRAYKKWQQ